MNIVFFAYLHGYGGAEKQIIMLANNMVNYGHRVTLVSISADNECYPIDKKVSRFFIPDHAKGLKCIVYRYIDIKKLLSNIKPDIIVNFWFQSVYLTAFIDKRIRGKIIYSERGDPGDAEYNGLLGFIRHIVIPKIDGFVFQSKGAQNYFGQKVINKSTIIANPVFINLNNADSIKREKRIVTVGRLHPQKNQKLLIDAFSLIADDFPDYILEIYGDGELRSALNKQINNLHLSEKVFLKGTSNKIHNLILNSALFVLSSDYEGLPNTLLEAMALGIPCISTDCKPGGAKEIIENGINGLVVSRNNKFELADAMRQVLGDNSLSLSLSVNGQKIINKYNPARIYRQWDEFFHQILRIERYNNED